MCVSVPPSSAERTAGDEEPETEPTRAKLASIDAPLERLVDPLGITVADADALVSNVDPDEGRHASSRRAR